MQTFLPFESFTDSARVLDRQRLGKQRVEVLQILKVLAGKTKAWSNHPAVAMWRGHERCLADYGCAICDEWTARGYRDSCRDKIIDLGCRFAVSTATRPKWLGDEALHASHRSNLIRKAPDHYGSFGWTDGPSLSYVWPAAQEVAAAGA